MGPSLVQLSDPHVTARGRPLLAGRIDTPAGLAAAVAAVGALRPQPQAVLLSGDLTERGRADEYAHLRELLAPLDALAIPAWLMPGNHDDVDALRAAFPDHPELAPDPDPMLAGFVLWERMLAGPSDRPALRLLALDSVVPGASAGALCAARLDWLACRLDEAPAVPTIVALHHPPFASGIGHMDAIALGEGADGLQAMLRRHPQVQRLVCGHLHRAMSTVVGGVPAMSAPSTAHQMVPDLRMDGPAAWRMEAPGMLWHAMVGGTLVSHVVAIGDHGDEGRY